MKSIFIYLLLVLGANAFALVAFKKKINEKLREETGSSGETKLTFDYFDAQGEGIESTILDERKKHVWYFGASFSEEEKTEPTQGESEVIDKTTEIIKKEKITTEEVIELEGGEEKIEEVKQENFEIREPAEVIVEDY